MCNDNDEAVAEGRVTTASAVGLVEAVSACAGVETSPDAHIPLGSPEVLRKDGEEEGDNDAIDPHQVPVAHARAQSIATRLVSRLTDVHKSGLLRWLRPGCKAQVAIEYSDKGASVGPMSIHTVVIYTQHAVPLCTTRTIECAGYTGPEMTAPSIFIVNHVLSTTLGEIKFEDGMPAIALFSDSTSPHINPSSKISFGALQSALGPTSVLRSVVSATAEGDLETTNVYTKWDGVTRRVLEHAAIR